MNRLQRRKVLQAIFHQKVENCRIFAKIGMKPMVDIDIHKDLM